MLPSGIKVILDLLAISIPEEVPFHVCSLIPVLLPFWHVSRKSCSMWVSNAAILSRSPRLCQTENFSGVFNRWKRKDARAPNQASQIGIGRQSCSFKSKISCSRRQCEMVSCRCATTNYFVTKVRREIFAHYHIIAIRCHSSIRNWLFGLRKTILYEGFPWCRSKWWAYFRLCSSWARLFWSRKFWTLSFNHACTAHAFFP